MKPVPSLPFLGVGIGLRHVFFEEIFETPRPVDWLEIIPESFMSFGGKRREILARARERWTLIPHGVGLSIGSLSNLNEDYLTRLSRLVEELDSPWFSDHFCFTRHQFREHHDLLPLLRTRETTEHLVRQIQKAQDRVKKPMLLENISDYSLGGRHEMEECEFIHEVLERSGASLLLDLNNVYVNSKNSNFDPYAYLQRIPVEKVEQLHLAGHWDRGDLLIDTHGAAVCPEVWELFRFWIGKTGRPVSTLIEWDHEIPSLDAVLDEADRAKKLMGETLAALPKETPHPARAQELFSKRKDETLPLMQYLNSWNSALSGGSSVKTPAQRLGIPEDRLKAYQQLVEYRFLDLFQTLFRRLDEAHPSAPWKNWIRSYLKAIPSMDWELNALAQNFPKFLQTLSLEGKAEPWHAELAFYEWALFTVRLSETSELQTVEQLNSSAFETALNPALALHLFSYDIGTWVHQLDRLSLQDRKNTSPSRRPNLLAISRNPKDSTCVFTQLGSPAASILQCLSEFPKSASSIPDLLLLLQKNAQPLSLSVEDWIREILFLLNQSVLLSPASTVEVLEKISQNPSQCHSLLFYSLSPSS